MKIYLAGPGVFFRDARQWGARLQHACSAHGIQGLFPLDGTVPDDADKSAQRKWIFRNNCSLIKECDAVFADMRAFRSESEPDSGTAFETGFAHALGKPVWLWLPDCTPVTTQLARVTCTYADSLWLDEDGLIVEDFSAPLNLMLWDAAAGTSCHPEPEQAIAEMANWLKTNQ
jgi:nucleoside deoxyribosyltransferase